MYDISKMDKKWNAENCLYKTAWFFVVFFRNNTCS